jgi:uncharacterized protein with PCYCGC motif
MYQYLTARTSWLVVLGLLVALALNSCGSPRAYLTLAPLEQLRDDIRNEYDFIREPYQLALANPAVFSQIPCYCGCRAVHKNVKDCFVREVKPDGTVVWDDMGLVCKICQDIVVDTRQMVRQSKSLIEIRAAIDKKYSHFGPSTDTSPLRP